jgi:hypothetical protein
MRRMSNSLLCRMRHIMKLLEGLKEPEGQLSLKTTRLMFAKKIQMEGDPTSFEEAMRSAHSSKWLEAMEDEMRSMSTNRVSDLEEFLKEPKQ